MDLHSESAFSRAKRDFRALVTNTVRVVVWFSLCNIAVVGATTYLSWGHQKGAQTLIGVAALTAGTLLALGLPLGALWVTAPVRQRNEARAALAVRDAHGVAITVEFTRLPGGMVQIGLRNHGPRLREAMINVLVPKRPGIRIYRRLQGGRTALGGGKVALGTMLETPEELEPGTPSLYWEETGLEIPGFGTSSLMRFVIGAISEPMPMKFKLGTDEWQGWREWSGHVDPLDSELEHAG
jgi:hypothetical protein